MDTSSDDSSSGNEILEEPPRLPDVSNRKRNQTGSTYTREKRSRLTRVEGLLSQIQSDLETNASQVSARENDGSSGDVESEGENLTPPVTVSRQKKRTKSSTRTESAGTSRNSTGSDTMTPVTTPRPSYTETPRSRNVTWGHSPGMPSTPGVSGTEVSAALKEITSLLNTVVKRIDKVESEIRQQRLTPSTSASESQGSAAKKKTSVPRVVKVCEISLIIVFFLGGGGGGGGGGGIFG